MVAALIIERLRADAAFLAATGGRIGATRQLRDLPGVAVQVIADPRPEHFKGPQAVRSTDAQIDIFARTPGEAADLRERAIAILTPPAVGVSVRFQRARVTNVRSGPESERGATDPRSRDEIYRESIDMNFWHNG